MLRVLSIDWDYFVEEDPMLDFGHREEMIFLNEMWSFRSTRHRLSENGKIVLEARDLSQMLPFRGDESLLSCLPCLRGDYRIGVAESHSAILKFLDGRTELSIVNIDAHHDLGYGDHSDYHFEMHETDCGNWGQFLVTSGRVAAWFQLYPKWRRKFPELTAKKGTAIEWAKEKLGGRFRVSTAIPSTVIHWRFVDLVFICRSGCWVPPNYDERFNHFCARLGSEASLPVRTVGKPIAEARA